MDHLVVMFMPANAIPGAEGIRETVDDPAGIQRGLEAAYHEGRAVFLSEQHRLFG
jgi:hypothetical protein